MLMNRCRVFHSAISVFLTAAVLLSGCASRKNQANIQRLPDSAMEEELEVGRQIHNSILSSFYPYTEPSIVAYVNQIGYSLTPHAERKELPYKFTVLYSDKIYATAAPGGYVYVTTRMLNFLESESQLAAVLAHEIAELQPRDSRFSPAKKFMTEATKTAAMVGPIFGQIGSLAALGFVLLNTATEINKPSLEKRVIKADANALQYMLKAGYDPQGMIDLVYKFAHADPVLMEAFRDYYEGRPISEKRYQKLQAAFEQLPLEGRSFSANAKAYQDVMQPVAQMHRA